MDQDMDAFEWLKGELTRKKQAPREAPQNFEGIPVDKNGYLRTEADAKDISGNVKYIPLKDAKYTLDVQAADISGVQLSVEEIQDPERFWSQHVVYDKTQGITRPAKKEDYLELASHIPEVYKALEAGTPLEELYEDPVLGATAKQYFSDTNMVRVSEGCGIVEMQGDGRHRIVAARELGEKMPAKVMNKLQYQPQPEQTISAQEREDSFCFSADWDEHGLFW